MHPTSACRFATQKTKPISQFTVEDVQSLNRALTISLTNKPGEIRTDFASWSTRDLTQSESNLLEILNQRGALNRVNLRENKVGVPIQSLKNINTQFMLANPSLRLWEDSFLDELADGFGMLNVTAGFTKLNMYLPSLQR